MIHVQCAWCRKWRANDEWVADPPHMDAGEYVSHGICPECLVKVKPLDEGEARA